MSEEEKVALKGAFELSKNDSLRICSADEGAGIVVLDKMNYYEKCGNLSEDMSTYEPLPEDPTQEYLEEWNTLGSRLFRRKLLERSEWRNLQTVEPVVPYFFALPKLHKPGVPFRPVVSTRNSLLDKAAKLIDYVIQPVVQSYHRCRRDSGHFILKLKDFERILREKDIDFQDVYLVSFDIVNFYPSIPHEEAISALEYYESKLQLNDKQFEVVRELLEFILSHSYVEFEGDFFRRIPGLPIGSSVGGPVACIYTSMSEDKLFSDRSKMESVAEIAASYSGYLEIIFIHILFVQISFQ